MQLYFDSFVWEVSIWSYLLYIIQQIDTSSRVSRVSTE